MRKIQEGDVRKVKWIHGAIADLPPLPSWIEMVGSSEPPPKKGINVKHTHLRCKREKCKVLLPREQMIEFGDGIRNKYYICPECDKRRKK